MSTFVEVQYLPPCDLCAQESRKKIQSAVYDAKTSAGPWAYMCFEHFARHRAYPDLGVGRGQKLVLPAPARVHTSPPSIQRHHDILREYGSIEAAHEAGAL